MDASIAIGAPQRRATATSCSVNECAQLTRNADGFCHFHRTFVSHSTGWLKKDGIEYRQYEGDHFQLGLTVDVFETILENMLQWRTYCRDDSRFMDGAGKCWNTGDKNGYDLGDLVREFLRQHGFETLSIAEVLWSEGTEGVGAATVFFSHIQALPVETAVKTLRESLQVYRNEIGVNPRFFIDYMCIRQAQQGDFDLPVVRHAIHCIPWMLVELDAGEDDLRNAAPVYLTRSFCVFEVFAAVEEEEEEQSSHTKVLVFGPAVKDPKIAPWLAAKVISHDYNVVNSSEAQCRWNGEKKKIDAFIEESVGYEKLDMVVAKAVAKGCTHGLSLAAQQDPSNINVAAVVGVQAADLTDEEMNQFCRQHRDPDLVRTVDIQGCSGLTSVEGLIRFLRLENIQFSGCNKVSTKSIATVLVSCTGVRFQQTGRGQRKVSAILMSMGRVSEAIEFYEDEFKAAKLIEGSDEAHFEFYSGMGNAMQFLGNFEEAINNHRMAVEIAKKKNNFDEMIESYNALGSCFSTQGKIGEALEYINLHLGLAQQIGDIHSEGLAYHNAGTCYAQSGRFEDAVAYHEKSLAIMRACENKRGEGGALSSIGDALAALGNSEQAMVHYNKSLEVAHQSGDRVSEAAACANVANMLRESQQYEKSLKFAMKALSIFREVNNNLGVGNAHCSIGNAHQELEQFPDAIYHYRQGLVAVQESGNKTNEGRIYGNIAAVMISLSRFDEAIENENRRLLISQQIGSIHEEGSACFNMSIAYSKKQDWPSATRLMGRAYQLFASSIGAEHPSTVTAASQYKALQQRALTQFASTLVLAQQTGDEAAESDAYGSIAEVLVGMAHYEEAIGYASKRLAIAQRIGDRGAEGAALLSIALAQGALGDYQKQLDFSEEYLRIVLLQRGEDHQKHHAEAFMQLGGALTCLGRHDDAIIAYQKQMDLCKAAGIPGEGSACMQIAIGYQHKLDCANAAHFMGRAHRAYESCYGTNSPYTMAAKAQHEALLLQAEGPSGVEAVEAKQEERSY
jgi:tetratricopeptide (TPR) repeat protein